MNNFNTHKHQKAKDENDIKCNIQKVVNLKVLESIIGVLLLSTTIYFIIEMIYEFLEENTNFSVAERTISPKDLPLLTLSGINKEDLGNWRSKNIRCRFHNPDIDKLLWMGRQQSIHDKSERGSQWVWYSRAKTWNPIATTSGPSISTSSIQNLHQHEVWNWR